MPRFKLSFLLSLLADVSKQVNMEASSNEASILQYTTCILRTFWKMYILLFCLPFVFKFFFWKYQHTSSSYLFNIMFLFCHMLLLLLLLLLTGTCTIVLPVQYTEDSSVNRKNLEVGPFYGFKMEIPERLLWIVIKFETNRRRFLLRIFMCCSWLEWSRLGFLKQTLLWIVKLYYLPFL